MPLHFENSKLLSNNLKNINGIEKKNNISQMTNRHSNNTNFGSGNFQKCY